MERSVKPTLSHRIEYALLRTFSFAAAILPMRLALAAGSALGWLAWKLLGIRKTVSLRNLKQAFPNRTSEELFRSGLESYMNAGRFMMEFIRQGRMSGKYVTEHVRISRRELEKIRKLEGALIITSHFGNWELLGIAFRYYLGDVSFLVGRQSNCLVDDYINRMRSGHGVTLYNRRSAVKGVVESVRKGGYVIWLSDQDAGDSGVVVDFFDYPASTPRGAAVFAVKLNVPIVPAVIVRDGSSPDHELVTGEPLYPAAGMSREDGERDITQRYTEFFEKMIERYPKLYWWSHRRWKTTGMYRN